MNNAYRILEQRFEQKNILEHIVALIDLDGQLNAPSAAADRRGEQKTALELRIHEILTMPDWGELFDKLDNADDLDEWRRANVRKAKEEVAEASVLPAELIEQLAKTRNDSVAVWFGARKENNDVDGNISLREAQRKQGGISLRGARVNDVIIHVTELLHEAHSFSPASESSPASETSCAPEKLPYFPPNFLGNIGRT